MSLVLIHSVSNATTVSTTTTWSSSSTHNDIIIDNGATLTISAGSTPTIITVNTTITVKPGAKLIIGAYTTVRVGQKVILESQYNNSSPTLAGGILEHSGTLEPHLSGATYQPWEGVEVWGMSNGVNYQPQTYAAKATITGGLIFGARIGIANCKNPTNVPNIFGPYGTEATGGIIIGNTAKFSYNSCSVFMINQLYMSGGALQSDASNFDDCSFNGVVNETYYPPLSSNGQYYKYCVFLSNVHNINFRSCNFFNLSSGGAGNMKGAINAFGGFVVRDCNFLGYGRTIIGSSPNYITKGTVRSSQFVSCVRNIELYHYDAPVVYENELESAPGNNGFLGIYLSGCPTLNVEENTISLSNYSGWTPGYGQPVAIGIAVCNAGENANEIYRNTIENTDFAIEAIGQNRKNPSSGSSGLKLLCNTMTNTIEAAHDIIVGPLGFPSAPYGITANTGILKDQNQMSGLTTYSAGNKFDQKTTSGGSRNYNNALLSSGSGYIIDYYFNSTAVNEKPTYTNIALVNQHSFTPSATCDAHTPPPGIMFTGFLANLPTVSSTSNTQQMIAYSKYISNAINHYLTYDSTKIPIDTLEMVLEAANYFYDYKIMLAKVYATQGKWQDAIDLLASLSTTFSLSAAEQAWINNIRAVYIAQKRLNENEGDWGSLNATLVDTLTSISDTDTYVGKEMAQILLATYGLADFPEPRYIWDEYSELKNGITTITTATVKDASKILYPNPAVDYIIVNSSKTFTAVTIKDITGKVVLASPQITHERINVSSLSQGMYIMEITYPSGDLIKEKFVKQ